MWSRKFEECIKCGTKTIKHKGNGLCRNCWVKDWKKKNPLKAKEIKRRDYIKHREHYIEHQKQYVKKNRKKYLQYWKDFHKQKAFGGLADSVLERDNYKCVLCNSKKMLIIHHIDKNNKNNILNNLVTLCRRCHPRIHYSKNRLKIESELHRNMKK